MGYNRLTLVGITIILLFLSGCGGRVHKVSIQDFDDSLITKGCRLTVLFKGYEGFRYQPYAEVVFVKVVDGRLYGEKVVIELSAIASIEYESPGVPAGSEKP